MTSLSCCTQRTKRVSRAAVQVLMYKRQQYTKRIEFFLRESIDLTTKVLSIGNAATFNDLRGKRRTLWKLFRNSSSWFKNYARHPMFAQSNTWRAIFRIPFTLFQHLVEVLTPLLLGMDTNFRRSTPVAIKVAAFLMYSAGPTLQAVGTQLGIGASTARESVVDVSKAISSSFQDYITFPTTASEVASAMKGFENIAGLPYCVGAVDGTHVRWLSCPNEQFFEYRCYKGYPSIVVFAAATADRKFTIVDVGRPGVNGDSTIYNASALKKNIGNGTYLGEKIPDLTVGDFCIRPYIMGDCAFELALSLMKSCSEQEKRSNSVLRLWRPLASNTRRPIECSFGVLKNRFSLLKNGLRFHHEDEIVRFVSSCVILHNLCIDQGDDIEEFSQIEEDVTAETIAEKRQRDWLLYYAINKCGER